MADVRGEKGKPYNLRHRNTEAGSKQSEDNSEEELIVSANERKIHLDKEKRRHPEDGDDKFLGESEDDTDPPKTFKQLNEKLTEIKQEYDDNKDVVSDDKRGKEDKEGEEEPNAPTSHLSMALLFILAIVGILCAYVFANKGCVTAKVMNKEKFTSAISSLSTIFVSQDVHTWKEINMLGSLHFEPITDDEYKKSRHPLVIVFVGFDQDKEIVNCLAWNVAQAFSTEMPLQLDREFLHKASQSHWKTHLDEAMENFLCNSSSRVVHVQVLNMLTYGNASIFYKYCDNSNTKHPEAVFIFSLTVPQERYSQIKSSEEKTVIQEIERYFSAELWHGTPLEQSLALSIRIVGSAFFINSETYTDKVKAICHF